MPPIVHHALLGLSIVALAGAGRRLGFARQSPGLQRVVAAAVIAAGAAILEALALGLVRLGTNSVALAVAAGVTWLVARRLAPPPAVPPGGELSSHWRSATPAARIGIGAALGLWLAWTAWLLKYPALGIDTVRYHFPRWSRGWATAAWGRSSRSSPTFRSATTR
jgi:hypothetical protein